MDFIDKRVLCGELVPVLLGVSPESLQTARRYFRQFGTISHVFCERVPLSLRLSFCIKFHTVRHASGDRLMIDALKDYATQLGNADLILYLLPCTVEYANLVWRNHEELERFFVLAKQEEMDRVWYGEPAKRKEY